MKSAARRVRALLTKVILENDNAAKHEIEAIVRKLEGALDKVVVAFDEAPKTKEVSYGYG